MVFKRKARRSRARGFSKKTYSRSKGGLSPMNVVLAGAIYGLARPIVSKMLPNMFEFGPVDSDNVAIGLAGWYGMKKGNGLIKALGAVALGSEAGIITARATSGITENIGSAGNDAYNY